MLTTTIGAYPKPDYVPGEDGLRREDGTARVAPTAGYARTPGKDGRRLEEILDRATIEVVREQVDVGIDIPTDGEIRRENRIRHHCRNLAGIDFDAVTEKQVRGQDPKLLPTITGSIRAGQPFLVRDWRIAQSATRKPVKITVPGPLTIGDGLADAFYESDGRLRGAALADALNSEIRALADAGCPAVQVDEPALAWRTEDALAFGIEHLERCFHKVPRSTERVVHVCCGQLDRLDAENYPKAPEAAYLDLARTLDEAAIDAVSIEDAHRPNDLSLLERFSRAKVILGVIAIARIRVEEPEEVRERLRAALEHIDAHRLIAGPDCGLRLLGRDLARRKLEVLVAAARTL